MDLLEAWANWELGDPPHVLGGDRVLLASEQSEESIVVHSSWKQAYEAPDFCKPGDSRLHLGLLPQPFIGDLHNATIYILLLNPGLSAQDYYGEYEVPTYRDALLDTLRQKSSGESTGFLFLDPQFSWHAGFDWWQGKLASVIKRVALAKGIPYAEARTFLASKLASIELIPYHSRRFRDGGGWLKNLRSAKLAKDFVVNTLLPRAEVGEALVIVTRKVKEWNLRDQIGVIQYTAAQARAAHLTPSSSGGSAILEHLGLAT